MGPLPVKIDKITEGVTRGADGQPVITLEITFHAGQFGPFSEHFPHLGFDATAANAQIAAFAAQLSRLNTV